VDLRESLALLDEADKQITIAGKWKQVYKDLKEIELKIFNAPSTNKIASSPTRTLLKEGCVRACMCAGGPTRARGRWCGGGAGTW
jgi:hypothetical protein